MQPRYDPNDNMNAFVVFCGKFYAITFIYCVGLKEDIFH